MSPPPRPLLHLIGPGRAGSALVACLRGQGYLVGQVVARRPEDAERAVALLGAGVPSCDPGSVAGAPGVVFLAVPDDALEGSVQALARSGPLASGSVVLHLSGARSSDLLKPLRRPGVAVGSLHPIRSFADREQPPGDLAGTGFAVEGDAEAILVARDLVRSLDGFFLPVTAEGKPLHHLAASWCSNAVVALFHAACRLEEIAGATREEAQAALLPLLQSTVENLEALGAPEALTGPVERGDLAVLLQHRDALRRHAPEELALFRALGALLVRTARDKGSLSETTAAPLLALMEEPS